jgi:tetratricopeptide (TPR) repeat protein
MYKEVMKRRTRRLEADHPVVLQCKVGLAALYRDQAQLAKAEAILQEVLALRMNRHGPDHDATHSSKHALAALYSSMGNIERSIPLFEEALQGRKAMLEPRHANILETQLALSADYCAAGKITEAIPLLEEVRAKVGDHRGLWLQAGDCLLTAYLRDGRTTEASDLLANHIQAKRQRYAGDGTRLALALSETGGALLAGKAYNEAEPLLRESLALAEAHAADVLDRHRIRSLLGVALVGRKKYAEAEPLLVQAFEGLDKTHAETSYAALIWRAQALERVVQLYVAWDKLDTAAEWRRKQEASPRTK